MGTSLTGLTPSTTYDALIKVGDNGPLSATAKYLSDGLGNDSPLAMSTTRVGINTTSPAVRFDVNGAIRTSSIAFGAEGGYFINSGASTLSRSYRIVTDLNAFGDFVIGQSTDQLGSTYVDRFNIVNSGNVGIGTSTPSQKLEVAGVIKIGDGTLSGTGGVELSSEAFFGFASQSNAYKFKNGTNTATYAILDSDGLKFNGDTSASNALDDYEEGTWTMGIAFGGASTGITYVNNQGRYTKIGRQVTAQGYMALSSKGTATGDAVITGLPFTSGIFAAGISPVTLRLENISFNTAFQGFINTTSTSIELEETTILGAVSKLTNSDFANSSVIMVSITYTV